MTRSTWTVAALALMACGLLAVAAAGGAADDKAKNLLKEPNKADSWRLEEHEKGKGTVKADEDGVLFEVTTPGDEHWHVQAFQTGLELKEGKEYTLTYKAKADPVRTITVIAQIDEDDWHAIGLEEEVELTKDWKERKQTFKAADVKAKNNRIGFMLGAEKGKVWIKDASLTEKE